MDTPTSNSPHRGIDRSKLPIYLAIALIALLFVPRAVLATLAFVGLGGTITYSALVHRREGWVSGLIFGLLLLILPVGAVIYAVARLVAGGVEGGAP
jgi:hypothetical protein